MSVEQAPASESVSANASGFGISYAVASIFNAVLVVLKEGSDTIHDGMAAITGHHWVTHGLLDLIVFLVLGFLLSRRNIAMSGNALVTTIVGATVISGLIIAGYFI